MAKKKLKICISLVLNNDNGEFNGVTEFKPDHAVDMLAALRSCLNEIYGIDQNVNKGFQNLTINSFKSIDVDVEETQ